MHEKLLRAIALRVAYHMGQKLVELHGQPARTLGMMVTAFILAGGPWLSQMGRHLAKHSGSLRDKVNRMSRFLCHSEFDVTEAFHLVARRIVETMAHAHPKAKILIAMDWTDLGDFMGLWLSLSYQGRGLPLSCMVLQKSLAEGSMTLVEVELIRRFLSLFSEEVRGRIVILADRGFAKSELFDEIQATGAHWGIRLPRDRQIRVGGAWIELRALGVEPRETRFLRGVEAPKEDPRKLNVAIRRLAPGEAQDPDDDTWYVATDMEDVADVLGWYARRFWIEEMFRDLKDRLNMDRHKLQTEESVNKMMLVVALAYLVILEDGTQWQDRVPLDRIMKDSEWGKLSVWRRAEIYFQVGLPEVPAEMEEAIVARWTNRRAA